MSKLSEKILRIPKKVKTNHHMTSDLHNISLYRWEHTGSNEVSDRLEKGKPQSSPQVFSRKHGRPVGEQQLKLGRIFASLIVGKYRKRVISSQKARAI